ncbi:MAG: patatin-like phospholipase family protein [Sinobacterium sp.]|nr:patatin-like phospholipase family protein [Sinobacterium sp.]
MKTYQALMNPMYTTGLALGGGAILGAAHIGVLRALEEKNIHPQLISGTSIGAFIAALYAFNVSADEIEEMALELNWSNITSIKLSKLSLFSNRKLGELVSSTLGDVNIEDARIPLAIIACDIATGQKVTFTEGPVAQAVMASCCLPGVFTPVEIDGRLLVDGGIAENVPVSALRDLGANSLIAVDLSKKVKYNEPKDIFDVMSNTISIAIDNNTKSRTRPADLIIAPDLTSNSRTNTDPAKIKEMIEIGYQQTMDQLNKNLTIKAWFRGLLKQLIRLFV